MDLITAVNLAFVSEQRRTWARTATSQPKPWVAQETQLGNIDRICLAIGDRLIAAGIWLKIRTTPLPTPQDL